MTNPPPSTRRGELLTLAASMFAERGLRATTVRDIADAAGILSGSLYHHFASKEEMVDEVLRSFLGWLFDRYQQIIDTEPNPLERFRACSWLRSTRSSTITRRWSSTRTKPSDCPGGDGSATSTNSTCGNERCGSMCSERASNRATSARISTPTWCTGSSGHHLGVSSLVPTWGALTAEQVGRQYLGIVLGGITPE